MRKISWMQKSIFYFLFCYMWSYNSDRNTFLRNTINDYAKVVNQSFKQKGAYIKNK